MERAHSASHVVGTLLGYELGEVSCNNVSVGSYLYKSTDTFTGKLGHYFPAEPPSNSLAISIVRDK